MNTLGIRRSLIGSSCLAALLLLLLLAALCLGPSAARAAGEVDLTFDSTINGNVYSTAVQPDGKIVIAGQFTTVMGTPRSRLARLNADGSLDLTFDPNPNGETDALVIQPDGKILIGGWFTSLQPSGAPAAIPRNYLARLLPDGTVDSAFDPNASYNVKGMLLQPDGKILVCGEFATLQPNGAATTTARNKIARLNADGSLDTGFDPKPNNGLNSMALQADGKIVVGGNFVTLQPNGAATTTARNKVARLNADGTVDPTFDPTPNGNVSCVAVQRDGKVLLAGTFTSLQPAGAGAATPRSQMARVLADGSVDTAFDPRPDSSVYSMVVQADGRIIVGGFFTTFQPNGAATATPRNRIARLNPDGGLDTGFDPNANSTLWTVASQGDGKVLLGGFFTTLRPNGAATATPRTKMARLLNDNTATSSVHAMNVSTVRWQREGSAPDVAYVTFERSVDGGTSWSPLGQGARLGGTSATWELTGLVLPLTGHLRARGPSVQGYLNGSQGLLETTAAFTILPDVIVEDANHQLLEDGSGAIAFGPLNVGTGVTEKILFITNTGADQLVLGAITRDGDHAADFSAGAPASSSLAPGESTTLPVSFTARGAGLRNAVLHIASNITGPKNPYDIPLSGRGLTFAQDSDDDGMSDAAELQFAPLGFDWQLRQTALVELYYAGASGAGLYTPAQVATLNVGTPLIQRNATTGAFTLTLGLQKSATVGGFVPFPIAPPASASLTPEGKLEIQFTVPDTAAFFRLQAQ